MRKDLDFFCATAFVVASLTASTPLSWKSAIDFTVAGNSELKAAQENMLAARFRAHGAYSSFLPQVNASLDYAYGDRDVFDPGSGISSSTTTDRYSAALTATQNLFNGFQDKGGVDQAAAALQVAQSEFSITSAKISFDLKSAYAGLRFAQQSVELQKDIIARREENFRLVELRFENGRENKGSVLLSKAYLNQAHYDALQARNAIRTAQTQLARVFGQELVADYTITDDVPVVDAPTAPNYTILMQESPEVRQAIAQQKAAEAAINDNRSGFFPSLDVNGSLSRQDDEFFPDNQRWSVGATLSWALFNGGRDYFATRAALAASSAAAATRYNTQWQLVARLQQAYSDYQEAMQKLEVDASFRVAAQTRADIARSKYNNGLISFEDWDLIENDLIARQKNFLQSQRDRVVAEAAWEQIQGKGIVP